MKCGDMMLIGVMGASGSGKGTVCEILAGLGAYIIDTDEIAHEVILRDRPAYTEIVAEFGSDVGYFLGNDGEIVRRRLGEVVFADDAKRKKLMEITYKYIVKQAFDIADEVMERGEYKLIVIDAPLLIEANMHERCDMVIGIIADENVRVARIVTRDSIAEEQARIRASKQTPLDVLRRHADFIIENNGGIDELREQVCELVDGLSG